MTDVTKTITVGDSGTTVTLPLKEAVLAVSPLLSTVFDKVDWDAGILLYPYTKVPEAGETAHVISGMSLTKTTSITEKTLAKETVEDAHPNTKISEALAAIMVQETAQKIEKSMLDTMLADATIPTVLSAGADWSGITACIKDMGTYVYNTVGMFHVVISLEDYLVIIQDTDYKRAKDILGPKVSLVVSTSLVSGQMVVMHEYGVAGATQIKEVEVDSGPSKDIATLLLPYRTGLDYDIDYVRVVKP